MMLRVAAWAYADGPRQGAPPLATPSAVHNVRYCSMILDRPAASANPQLRPPGWSAMRGSGDAGWTATDHPRIVVQRSPMIRRAWREHSGRMTPIRKLDLGVAHRTRLTSSDGTTCKVKPGPSQPTLLRAGVRHQGSGTFPTSLEVD